MNANLPGVSIVKHRTTHHSIVIFLKIGVIGSKKIMKIWFKSIKTQRNVQIRIVRKELKKIKVVVEWHVLNVNLNFVGHVCKNGMDKKIYLLAFIKTVTSHIMKIYFLKIHIWIINRKKYTQTILINKCFVLISKQTIEQLLIKSKKQLYLN